MSIKHWPSGEQPREKLLQRGVSALSDAELLAIFLRVGVKGSSAVELARELLQYFGGLRPLLDADLQHFTATHGLGVAKYCQLHATLEIGRRYLKESLQREDVFTDPYAVREFLRYRLRGSHREEFLLLFLDNHNRLIGDKVLFQGTVNQAEVHPREVAKVVLEQNAAALILAHNHPSGIATPSEADRQITKKLQQLMQQLDVRLLDHFIIGDQEIVSMAEMGLL